MATIPGVSDGELIRTTWGDAVADELNNNTFKKTGGSVTGNVSVSGTLSAAGRITCGGDMVSLTAAQSSNATSATRRDYVDAQIATRLAETGGFMSGLLTINPAGNNCLRVQGSAPVIDLWNEAGSARMGAVSATSSSLNLTADGTATVFFVDGSEQMRVSSGGLLIGKAASSIADNGHEYRTDGQYWTTATANGVPSIIANHAGAANVDNNVFFSFRINNTTAGHIDQGTGTNCIFNAGSGGTHVATSDYRYKDDLGPIDDPVGRLMQLQPKHLRWKEISGASGEFDGFLAHEVTPVEASAVTGDKDAVHPQDHPDDPGGINPQGLDEKRLVPLLTAALQDAHAKIDALTARLDALEAA